MSDKSDLANIEIEIKAVRELLTELEEAAKTLKEQNQHKEINHLEDYISEKDHEMKALTIFKEEITREVKDLVNWFKKRIPPNQHRN